ncbi:MAG: NTP/NDP exchange transporter [Lysobacter sp.]
MRSSQLSLPERCLQVLASVRPGEGRSIGLMLLQVFLLLLAYYLIRPVREALILVDGTPEVRSYAVGAVAVTLIFLIPLYKLLFDRLDGHGGKSALMRWVMAFFVSNLLLFSALGALGVPIGVPFFVWVGVFSVMLVAQFWAFAADLFNLHAGKRLFGLIAVGSALGAWTGSQLSGQLFASIGPYRLMLVSALLLGGVAWLGKHVEASVPEQSQGTGPEADEPEPDLQPAPRPGQFLGGFNVVLRSRYLLLIAAFVTVINWVNSTGGYILSTFVDRHASQVIAANPAIDQGAVIGQFYSDYFGWISLLQLLLQMFVVSRLLRYLGVRTALLVLPLVMVANYAMIAWMPLFALVRVTMIAENSFNYSVHGTSCHSLFLPLSRREKYVGQTTIDTFFWRFGDLLHALMILTATQWLALGVSRILLVNLALALVAFAIAVLIGRRHEHNEEASDHLPAQPVATAARMPPIEISASGAASMPAASGRDAVPG